MDSDFVTLFHRQLSTRNSLRSSLSRPSLPLSLSRPSVFALCEVIFLVPSTSPMATGAFREAAGGGRGWRVADLKWLVDGFRLDSVWIS